MSVNVNQANLIQKETETKLVRSLALPEPVSNEAVTNKIPSDNNKINLAKANQDPLIKENKIQFANDTNPENQTKPPKVISESAQSNAPDKQAKRGGIIKYTINQVTETNPLINNISMKDKGTLALTSSLLSAINIPEAEPIKFTLNVLSTDIKKDELKKTIAEGNIEGTATNLVKVTKSYWGTIISAAKFADFVASNGKDYGFITARTVNHVGKVTGTVSNFANKLALPFAVVGTGLTLWDFKKENDKLNEKHDELEKFHQNQNNNTYKVIGKGRLYTQEHKIIKEIRDKKVNLAMKGIGGSLSTISTYALITSVVSPKRAAAATPLSLVTGIAGSITIALADEKVRETLNNKMKILKKRYLD